MQNEFNHPSWFVGYTLPNTEKKVRLKALRMGFETFLPLNRVLRQWSDRQKILEVPLFPNYIFIKTTFAKRFELLSIRELVRFVAFQGELAKIPDGEIEIIKKIVDSKVDIYRENNFRKGAKVRIVHGQFAGFDGILIHQHGSCRFLMQLETLQQSLLINIDAESLEEI